MSDVLHFKSPDREGLTLCGRPLQGRRWTADGDEFSPLSNLAEFPAGRCGNCRRGLRWQVRPIGKGMYLGCPPKKGVMNHEF